MSTRLQKKVQTNIPPAVKGRERSAIQALANLTQDGKVTGKEAQGYFARYGDLFQGNEDKGRYVKAVARELVKPHSTYFGGVIPRASLDPAARDIFERMNPTVRAS